MLKNVSYGLLFLLLNGVLSSLTLAKDNKCTQWSIGSTYNECIKNCIRAECDVVHVAEPNWCETKCYSAIFNKTDDKDEFWDRTRSDILAPDQNKPYTKKNGLGMKFKL